MTTNADVDHEVVLQVTGLSKSFGGVDALKDVALALHRGEVRGVIGPNGAGKTSLVNVISGRARPSSGSIRLGGREVGGLAAYRLNRLGLARSYQQANIFAAETVRENLVRARAFAGRGAVDAGALIRTADLGSSMTTRAGALPYGQQKLLGLIMTLSTGPSVVLMDEPAAGLAPSERSRIDDLVRQSTERGCAVVIVEHDMDLIRRLCPEVLVLDSGTVIATGATDEVLSRPDVLAAYLGSTSSDDVDEDDDQNDNQKGDRDG